jgi:hypothetical protein
MRRRMCCANAIRSVAEALCTVKGLAELDRPDNDRYSIGFQLRKLPLPDQVV